MKKNKLLCIALAFIAVLVYSCSSEESYNESEAAHDVMSCCDLQNSLDSLNQNIRKELGTFTRGKNCSCPYVCSAKCKCEAHCSGQQQKQSQDTLKIVVADVLGAVEGGWAGAKLGGLWGGLAGAIIKGALNSWLASYSVVNNGDSTANHTVSLYLMEHIVSDVYYDATINDSIISKHPFKVPSSYSDDFSVGLYHNLTLDSLASYYKYHATNTKETFTPTLVDHDFLEAFSDCYYSDITYTQDFWPSLSALNAGTKVKTFLQNLATILSEEGYSEKGVQLIIKEYLSFALENEAGLSDDEVSCVVKSLSTAWYSYNYWKVNL